MLKDSDKMPFGAHKGKAMIDVPAKTLLWYYENFREWSTKQLPVKEYIEDNMDVLKKQSKDEDR